VWICFFVHHDLYCSASRLITSVLVPLMFLVVTSRKDDVPAAREVAIVILARLVLLAGGGGLIQTISG
jgi:hypothetical protein